MSCEIKCISKVVELDRIKKLFGLASGKWGKLEKIDKFGELGLPTFCYCFSNYKFSQFLPLFVQLHSPLPLVPTSKCCFL